MSSLIDWLPSNRGGLLDPGRRSDNVTLPAILMSPHQSFASSSVRRNFTSI